MFQETWHNVLVKSDYCSKSTCSFRSWPLCTARSTIWAQIPPQQSSALMSMAPRASRETGRFLKFALNHKSGMVTVQGFTIVALVFVSQRSFRFRSSLQHIIFIAHSRQFCHFVNDWRHKIHRIYAFLVGTVELNSECYSNSASWSTTWSSPTTQENKAVNKSITTQAEVWNVALELHPRSCISRDYSTILVSNPNSTSVAGSAVIPTALHMVFPHIAYIPIPVILQQSLIRNSWQVERRHGCHRSRSRSRSCITSCHYTSTIIIYCTRPERISLEKDC